MNAFRRVLTATLVISLITLGGCKASSKNDPTRYTDTASKMTEQDNVPFNKSWFTPDWNGPLRTSIVIAPVDTQLVKQSDWWKKAEEKNAEKLADVERDLRELADFTRDEFRKAFQEDEKHRFTVLDSPQTGSILFQLAIIDVDPNRAALGALGLAATILAAPLGVAILAKEGAKGGIAMEGRMKDANTGQVIALFADREKGKFAPINVARATTFGEVQKSIREWAEQWVKLANAVPGEGVKDTKPFTLRPW